MNKIINLKIFNNLLSRYQALFFVVIVLVSFLRTPFLFLSPRFWAEEGTVYFAFAYNHSWVDTLSSIHMGYFSLFANLTAILSAKIVPLEMAPFISLLFSFIVQLLPIFVVIKGDSEFFKSDLQKIIIILLILISPYNKEIWLNTIGSQFYLTLTVFLILLDNHKCLPRQTNIFYMFLLLFSGLSGILSCLFLPIFIYKYFIKRYKNTFLYVVILFSCLIFHLSYIFNMNNRILIYDYTFIPHIIFMKNIVFNVFGINLTTKIAENIMQYGSLGIFILGLLLWMIYLFLSVVFMKKDRYSTVLFLGSYALIIIFCMLFSLENNMTIMSYFIACRYFFVPNIIILMFLLYHVRYLKRKLLIYGVYLFIMSSIYQGLILFPFDHYDHLKCPKWTDEIKKWKSDSAYQPIIPPVGWKLGNWRVRLKR